MSAINRLARIAVYERLSDAEGGLNRYVSDLAADYEISPFALDFSETSANFLQSYVEAETLQSLSTVQFPLGLLYTVNSENLNIERSRTYSGPVNVILQIHLSWRGSQIAKNSEDVCDLVQEAVYRCLNEWDYPWAPPLVYNGQIKLTKTAVTPGGDFWRQCLTFSIPFELHVG